MKNDAVWMDATISAADDIADGVRRIEFATAAPMPAFDPGSHIAIRAAIGDGHAIRTYSCLPDAAAGRVAVGVKLHPNSRGGSRFMFDLKVGDRVRITTPENRFDLSWRAPDYLLLAGGIGVTPIYGMAQALAARGTDLRMEYGGQSLAAMPFLDPLRALLGDRLAVHAQDQGAMIDLDAAIARLSPEGELYICGPLPMLEAAKRAWAKAGRATSRFRYEVFGDTGRFTEAPFTVRVAGYDREVTVPSDRSLLDALDDAGIPMIHDCRRGECGLCAVDVLDHSGEIDHRDVFLSDAEKGEGTKLCACVSRIAGGTALIDTGYRPQR
ncbi:PDR/VanB family oxidoreductase [Niveispirillum sp.]|uniref:PDR/VanB family oxidoreductase n=1 Tax=Niveispirillum sp. TaxID=1917217 RepID=UPI001B443D47|nr:PDR/VanB family oxidoreductase [Niveispirillum sp.]MBP7337288.1 oxidoreductase [Niveispirillum sp.]